MFPFKKTSKLENQVRSVVVWACLVLGSLAIWASSYLTYRLLYNYSMESVRDGIAPTLEPLSNAVYVDSPSMIKTSMDELIRNSLVCKVNVVSADKTLQLMTGYPRCIHGYDITLYSPFNHQEVIGTLRIGISYRTIFRRIYTLIAFQIIAGLLILLTVVSSLWWATNRLIIHPVIELIHHLHGIEPGSLSLLPIPDNHVHNELGQLISDINDLLTKANKAHEKEKEALAFKAEHDCLTGLYNRASGLAAIGHYLDSHSDHKGVLIMLDLDRFKHINDTYGHPVGDKVLVEVAKRLRNISRQDDVVARLGGDEFLIGLMNIGSNDNLEMIIRRLIRVVSQPMDLGDGRYDYVGASLGASVVDEKLCLETVLLTADTAMYNVKRAGKHGFCIYSNNRYSVPVLISSATEEKTCQLLAGKTTY